MPASLNICILYTSKRLTTLILLKNKQSQLVQQKETMLNSSQWAKVQQIVKSQQIETIFFNVVLFLSYFCLKSQATPSWFMLSHVKRKEASIYVQYQRKYCVHVTFSAIHRLTTL